MLTVPTLTTRVGKGSPLTNSEGDANWTAIQNFLNAAASLFATSIQDNGALKFYNRDLGGANDYAIAPAGYLQAYADGVIYLVRANSGNTGDSTLRVASGASTYLASIPLRKNGSALQQGDVVAGQVFMAVYDATDKVFNVVIANSQVSSAITSVAGATGDTQWYTPTDIALRNAVQTVISTPNDGDQVSIGGTTYTFKTTLDAVANHVATKVAGVASAVNATANLIKAINATGTPGTEYGAGTVINPNVFATAGLTTTSIIITPNLGTSGSALALTESTAGVRLSWNIASLIGANPATFQHGFTQIPTGTTASLVCISADQGFTAFQAVPLREFFNGSNQPAFTIQSSASTISVTQTTGAPKVINASSGTAAAIDLTKWRLRVAAHSIVSASVFDPVALPNAANTDAAPIVHGFSTTPIVVVGLINTAAELGFSVGDFVPLSAFYDASADPAFSVKLDATNITLHQNTVTPKVIRLTDGSSQSITPGSWSFQVYAFAASGASATVQPAMELAVANPDGAIGWNGDILIFNYGRFSAKTFLSKWNGTNNNISKCQALSPPANFANIAPFRFSDGSDRMIWTSARGVFTALLNSPTSQISSYGSQALQFTKPVWATSLPNPEFFLAGSEPYVDPSSGSISGYASNSLKLLRLPNTNGTVGAATNQIGATLAATIGGSAVSTTTFSLLDLTNVNIGNVSTFTDYHSSSASILLFQYNPVTGRIYVVTAECGYMFVFKLNRTDKTITTWWPNSADSVPGVATKYSQLSCDKIIALPGGGGGWANAEREHIAVEYDLTTGQEKSIVYTRVNSTIRTGSVTRILWRE